MTIQYASFPDYQLTTNHIFYLELALLNLIFHMQEIASFIQEPPMGNTGQEGQANGGYTCEQFIQTLTNLHTQSILFYCPYNEETLISFYQHSTAQKGTTTINQQTVLQFIAELKVTNRRSLLKQVQFYQNQMNRLLQEEVKIISHKDFRRITERFKDENRLLTEIMIQNSKQSEYIVCDKVIVFTEEVKTEIEESFQQGLTMTKLKTHRFSKRNSPFYIQISQKEGQRSMKRSNYPRETQQSSIKQIVNRYIKLWHRKFNLYQQFGRDERVRQDMQQLDEQMRQQEQTIFDEMDLLMNNCKSSQDKCREFQDILQGVRQQENLYQEIIEQHKAQSNSLKQQLAKATQQTNSYLQQYNSISQTLQQTKNNIFSLARQHGQMQIELRNYKTSYGELYTQYQRLVATHSQETVIKKQEQTRKIFTDRTVKEQLEDTLAKFERTLALREKQRKLNKEKEEKHIDTIANLETKLQELQRQLKQKNQHLSRSIRESKIIHNRQSKARVSINPQSKNQTSKCFHYDANNNKSRFTSILPQIRCEYICKSRFSKVNIGMEAVIEEREQPNIILLPEQQNLIQIIEQDNDSHPPDPTHQANTVQKKESRININVTDNSEVYPVHFNRQTFLSPMEGNFRKIKSFFNSRGVIINPYGIKFETTILLTKRRFCLFDTKVRLLRFLPVRNIKAIRFCHHNPTLFVLQVKNIHELDPSTHIANDMVFSTRNTHALALFLAQQYREIVNQLKIEVDFRREEEITLAVDNKLINLKHEVPGINSPLRLCLSAVPVFYGKIIESEHFFNFYKDSCFVVQPSAIFCFEGTEVLEIEHKREFLYLLPLVDSMKMKERPQNKKTPGKHLTISYHQQRSWEKSYCLTFLCRQDMKRFMKAVQLQLQENREKRQKMFRAKQSYTTN